MHKPTPFVCLPLTHPCPPNPTGRLVQKDVGGEGESLWLLATESVAPEDACWPPLNPAAARQLLGGISSLSTVSKQVARAALAVSNTLPLKVGGWLGERAGVWLVRAGLPYQGLDMYMLLHGSEEAMCLFVLTLLCAQASCLVWVLLVPC